MQRSLLLLPWLFAITLSQTPNPYCDISQEHYMCLYPPGLSPSCSPAMAKRMPPTASQKELILRLQNEIRQRAASGNENRCEHGPGMPPSGNMTKLTWDPELEEIAQRQVDQCGNQPDCTSCRQVLNDRYSYVGQNIYRRNYLELIAPKTINYNSVITSWYNEVDNFNCSAVEQYTEQDEQNNYAQLIWGETEKVGCGSVIYRQPIILGIGINVQHLTVCNYGEGGSLHGYPVYEIGEPCSACANCSTTYNGLCE